MLAIKQSNSKSLYNLMLYDQSGLAPKLIISMGVYKFAYVLALALTFCTLAAGMPGVMAGDSVDLVFPKGSSPYGLGYDEWSAKWWVWLLSIPGEMNPSNDIDGSNCAIDQSGPVWYLAGSQGELQVRHCSLPAGKAILFPVLTSECSYAENRDLRTPDELLECAKNEHEGYISRSMVLKVDGTPIVVDDFRVQSTLFNFTFPPANVFGAPPGPTQGVSDGWFVMLKPLSPGQHTIEFSGEVRKAAIEAGGFSTAVIYNLDVSPS